MAEGRSQALALDYVIGLGVAMALTMGLLIGGGGFMAEQREAAARTQLDVVGQQLVADIEAADRLATAAGVEGTVSVESQLPETIANSQYNVELVESSDPYVELRSVQPNTTVRVEFTNVTAVTASRISGGTVTVEYTADALALRSGGS